MTPTEPTTRAENEMRLIIATHKAGLGTPKLTLQRLQGWADEIKNYEADQAHARGLYVEAIRQLEQECKDLEYEVRQLRAGLARANGH